MNNKWKLPENEDNRKKLIESIVKILELHTDESGIIHTGNFAIAEFLTDKLSKKIQHKIVHHNPNSLQSRDSVIRNFSQKNKKPTILISPSITEGLDLIEDIARFGIICKIPYGNLMNSWIKRRMELSKIWYKRQALIDVIQGCGRVVRSADDYGVIYILDECWGFLYESSKNMIPEWWQSAYQKI